MNSIDQKQFPHKLTDVLEAANKDERSRKHFVNGQSNEDYRDQQGDTFIDELKKDPSINEVFRLGVAQAKIASMPLTHCDYIMSEFLNRMHDLFEAQCTANYTAGGAKLRGTLKMDGIAYRITVEPIRRE